MLKLWIALQSRLVEVRDSEEGQTMVEYGLLAALIAVALIVTLGLLSGALDGVFTEIKNAL